MKRTIITIFAFYHWAATSHAEIRTFTSSAGTTLKGELVSVVGDAVTIKKEDGTPLTLKLAAFSRVDQAWLQTQAKTTPTAVGAIDPVKATKDAPFVNSLGMKFVPVPGTNVLFCTTLAPGSVYAQFDQEVNGAKPRDPSAENFDFEKKRDPDLFPASEVSWDQAKAFCDWLSKKDNLIYRMPTDREWSMAIGIGGQEFRDAPPAELDRKLKNVYPWGSQWPPPKGYGNFCDEAYRAFCDRGGHKGGPHIKGYEDGEIALSPMTAFPPNKLGIHDLSGNQLQWCDGWYDKAQTKRFLRGSTWGDSNKDDLLSSSRRTLPLGDMKTDRVGAIRVVLVTGGTTPPGTTSTSIPTPAPAVSVTTTPAATNPPSVPGAFTNSLGMQFVPVKDARVWFCVHETRRQDYAAFATAVPGTNDSWKNQQIEGLPCGGEDNHPVVGVNWGDAKNFCDWLSQKEGKLYRLPTDQEWSIAVGLGRAERWDKDTTPEMLAEKEQMEFPWGGSYPPKASNPVGNYADSAMKEKIPASATIEGYRDGFPSTAPVMSFKPNKNGLYDMGGNVWEWVADWWNADRAERLLRGGSWFNEGRRRLLSSGRFKDSPERRNGNGGFRCVIELPVTEGPKP